MQFAFACSIILATPVLLPKVVAPRRYARMQASIASQPPVCGCRTPGFITKGSKHVAAPQGSILQRRHHNTPPRPTALPYTAISIPAPLPNASTLPDEPPLRSEQIDLTLAIKRCRTWQELRQLYWTNRTRQGVINVVSYFTRLAALVPELPRLLAEVDVDDSLASDSSSTFTANKTTRGNSLASTSRGRWRQQQGADSHRSSAAATAATRTAPPPKAQSIVERAALRQLIVRLVYDACNFTEEHVGAGRLEDFLHNPIEPWDTDAYLLYLADCDAATITGGRRHTAGSGGGSSSSGGSAEGVGRGSGSERAAAGASSTSPPGSGQEMGRQSTQPTWRQQQPLSFWEWIRDRPELWDDPVATTVTRGLRHWSVPNGGGGAEAGGAGAFTPAAAAREAARRRRVPLCFGPQELTTLMWAAARLQLHVAVPEHAAWLLHDLLYGSYGMMPEFDGRQLAQLGYSLAQLGPCVPPARWQRRFLAATRRRMAEMDSQSLANLAHSLDPLQMVPDPDWFRCLLTASGPLMELDIMSGPELTQLGWAVFRMHKRLCRVRRWAHEVLKVAGTITEYRTSPVETVPPSSSPRVPTAVMMSTSHMNLSAETFNASASPFLTKPGPNASVSGGSLVRQLRSAGSGAYNPTTTLLEFLPSLLYEIGAHLPPDALEELCQLLLLPSPQPLTVSSAAVAVEGVAALGCSSGKRIEDVDSDLDYLAVESGSEPWFSDRAVEALLAAVSGVDGMSESGNVSLESRLAVWLLRQPPLVFVLSRLWADTTRAAASADSSASSSSSAAGSQVAAHITRIEDGREEGENALTFVEGSDHNGNGEEDGLEAELQACLLRDTAFNWKTYVKRYMEAMGTRCASLEIKGMNGAACGLAPPSTPLQPPHETAAAAAMESPVMPAISPAAAAAATPPPLAISGTSLLSHSSIRPAQKHHQVPKHEPHHRTAAPTDSVASTTITTSTKSVLEAGESTPLLFMLHTRCWPSGRWLDALAATATKRLYSPNFRAQSLGMLLWSLAGLGFVPPPGWLQPWLQRAEQLSADFRPANLVSVLCALSAWGHMPEGGPERALRSATLRLLPSMGGRELQLTASALSQLCELPPPPSAPPGPPLCDESVTGRARGTQGAQGRKYFYRNGSNEEGERRDTRYKHGTWSHSGGHSSDTGPGLFVPLPAGSVVGVHGSSPLMAVMSQQGSAAADALGGGQTGGKGYMHDSDIDDVDDDFVRYSGGATGGHGGRPLELQGRMQQGSLSSPPQSPPRHRQLDSQIGRLLVQRAVQVSYSYRPRHMASMLQLLTIELNCLKDIADLRELLDGHAMYLEGAVAAAYLHTRWRQQQRHSPNKQPGDNGDHADDKELKILTRHRELRELAESALKAVRAITVQNHMNLSDEAAAVMLPTRWWRAYVQLLKMPSADIDKLE